MADFFEPEVAQAGGAALVSPSLFSSPIGGQGLEGTICPLVPLTRTLVYTYDNLARLTGASYPAAGIDQPARSYTYTYDAAGNRTGQTANGAATSYQYDAANRLVNVNGQSYTYDNNGNLLNDGLRTYAYDAANRLTQVVSGTVTTQFTYNGDGDRVSQTVNGVPTTYAFDPVGLTQVLIETTGGQTKKYVPGLAQFTSGAWAYQLPDGLGSVRQLTDPSGQISLIQNYDPFGNVLQQVGAASPFGYTGEQIDPTGLVFLRARYYNPAVGRFLTADSIIPDPLRSMGWNRYGYVGNNPIRYTDPSGYAPPTPTPSYCYSPQGPNDTRWRDDPICQPGKIPGVTPTPAPLPPLMSPPMPPINPCNCATQEILIPQGGRLDISAMLLVGLDLNIDFVTANFKPSETSIIWGLSFQGGLDIGLGWSVGPLWHNATCLKDYKSIDRGVGGTVLPEVGGEVNYEWSGTTDIHDLYIGVGSGAELGAWLSRQLAQWDMLNGDFSTILD